MGFIEYLRNLRNLLMYIYNHAFLQNRFLSFLEKLFYLSYASKERWSSVLRRAYNLSLDKVTKKRRATSFRNNHSYVITCSYPSLKLNNYFFFFFFFVRINTSNKLDSRIVQIGVVTSQSVRFFTYVCVSRMYVCIWSKSYKRDNDIVIFART